jgi:mRNA-degrading endonuclease RelE of RelBE toxin-antitoxin system
MPRQKNDIAFGKLTGEELVGWRAKRGFYRLPFLVEKPIDCV